MEKHKVSLLLNILIAIFVLFATIAMIVNFHFMGDGDILSVSSLEAFKFFTVDSNILMGIAALIFA